MKKVTPLKHKLKESQILFIYRYLSLFITSAFYLLSHPQHSIMKKTFIIGCLVISAITLSYLYLKNEKSTKNIKILLLIETIGNSILLIPSGGINSPFVWYTLNTILISSIFLKKRYCWINFLVYILTSSVLAYFSNNENLDISGLMREESNLILSFIMIVAAVQVWSLFVKRTKEKSSTLQRVNEQLESANSNIIESIDHIKTLYQSVNILTNQGNKEGLINLLYEYTKKITDSNIVFYYDISEDMNRMVTDDNNNYLMKLLEKNIIKELKNILEHKEPIEISTSDTRFVMMPVKTAYKDYGILGCEETNSKESVIYKNKVYQIQFLSELISITFERLYLEEINDRLLISEEQNRIANEIHDSVLQRLFSMSCGVFSLMRNLDKISTNEIEKELNLIRNTTDTVMKELRKKIYGLSWEKSGTNSFITDIKQYINETKRLNDVIIPFTIVGNDELLSCEQKKALYRIICEGIANAVHHGKAKIIEVSLKVNSQDSVLDIIDDGTGFNLDKVNKDKTKGLGIRNLYQLSESLGGKIKVNSNLGNGTRIKVTMPNVILMKGEKAFV